MRSKAISAAVAASALALLTPTALSAQATDPVLVEEPREEDDEFPWGLLGLLGLAGLLGLKRRDDHVDVDNRTRR